MSNTKSSNLCQATVMSLAFGAVAFAGGISRLDDVLDFDADHPRVAALKAQQASGQTLDLSQELTLNLAKIERDTFEKEGVLGLKFGLAALALGSSFILLDKEAKKIQSRAAVPAAA